MIDIKASSFVRQSLGATMFTKALRFPVVNAILLALLSGCSLMSAPGTLDLRMAKASLANAYSVTMRPLVEPIAINEIHAWEVQLASPDGVPIRHARISLDGGMPQHGHGLPTKPRVTSELADGRYRVDGVKFSMTGWWELKLTIDAEKGRDQITFNLVLPEPAGAAGAP
jgi:hypothetical protein